MLNIRTIRLSVVLVLALILAVQLVTARTKAVSAPANDTNIVPESQELSAKSKDTYSIPIYRFQFGECFDVSITDQASCHAESKYSVLAHPASLDECFDVSLIELASCRNGSQEFASD